MRGNEKKKRKEKEKEKRGMREPVVPPLIFRCSDGRSLLGQELKLVYSARGKSR